MKILIPAALFAILLSGCVASIQSFTKKTIQAPYKNVMVLYVEGSIDLYKLDSATYATALQRRFNSLGSADIRIAVESRFKENLISANTKVVQSSECFEVNKDIPFQEFNNTVQSLGVDAILVVNTEKEMYANTINNNVKVNEVALRANLKCYLIDVKNTEPFWLAQASFDTNTVGYLTPGKALIGEVALSLVNNKYIADPVAGLYK
jgi:hypothetical protein